MQCKSEVIWGVEPSEAANSHRDQMNTCDSAGQWLSQGVTEVVHTCKIRRADQQTIIEVENYIAVYSRNMIKSPSLVRRHLCTNAIMQTERRWRVGGRGRHRRTARHEHRERNRNRHSASQRGSQRSRYIVRKREQDRQASRLWQADRIGARKLKVQILKDSNAYQHENTKTERGRREESQSVTRGERKREKVTEEVVCMSESLRWWERHPCWLIESA